MRQQRVEMLNKHVLIKMLSYVNTKPAVSSSPTVVYPNNLHFLCITHTSISILIANLWKVMTLFAALHKQPLHLTVKLLSVL